MKFEDVKGGHVTQVERMLRFLEFPFDSTDLKAKLNNSFDVFRRPHKEEFEHYTQEQKKYINTMILDTIKILSEHKMEHFFNLEEYLDTS